MIWCWIGFPQPLAYTLQYSPQVRRAGNAVDAVLSCQSLNISRSQSRSLKVIWNDTLEYKLYLDMEVPLAFLLQMSVTRTVSEIFSVKLAWLWNLGQNFRSHSKWSTFSYSHSMSKNGEFLLPIRLVFVRILSQYWCGKTIDKNGVAAQRWQKFDDSLICS